MNQRGDEVCENLCRQRQLSEIQPQTGRSDVPYQIRCRTLHNHGMPQHQEGGQRFPIAAEG